MITEETTLKYRKALGMRLKRLRVEKFGQHYGAKVRCAEALGINETTWGKMEGRPSNPTLQTLLRIAHGIGCDLTWLFTGIGEPFPVTLPKKPSPRDQLIYHLARANQILDDNPSL